MMIADTFTVNVPARPDGQVLDADVPFLGVVMATWESRPAERLCAYKFTPSTGAPELPEHSLRLGRLHLILYRDARLRPSRLAWTALLLTAGNVAGWTHGQVWEW